MGFKIDKPIRLIELFAGIGAQAKALEMLGVKFEHHRICEFDKYAVASYNAIHGTHFQPTDIRDLRWRDLGVTDTDKYCYILTYSFPCQDLSVAGKQRGMIKGSGTRSGLLWEVERLLTECVNGGVLANSTHHGECEASPLREKYRRIQSVDKSPRRTWIHELLARPKRNRFRDTAEQSAMLHGKHPRRRRIQIPETQGIDGQTERPSRTRG